MRKISIIIPVYNRPDEVDELLHSLTEQTDTDFEVVIVEDGSKEPCKEICDSYADRLDIKYLFKENSGPGGSRNYGAERCSGDYLLILDSDVIVPSHYIETMKRELEQNYCDAYGGPDAASEDFSDMQKAVNYAMTSMFTTGGIRGGKKQMERFHPRSFNLGISKEAFQAIGGFSQMRYGEDIDLSIRIYKAGYKVRLITDLYVYHKRRTDMEQFFNQVRHSGNARIALWQKHPDYKGSLRLVHFLPAIFVIGTLLLAFMGLFSQKYWLPIVLYALIVMVDSTLKNNKNFKIGFLSIAASFTQLYGYGIGFIESMFEFLKGKRQMLKKRMAEKKRKKRE